MNNQGPGASEDLSTSDQQTPGSRTCRAQAPAVMTEREQVAQMLEEVMGSLPEGLTQFVQSEMAEDQPLAVAGIVLASATPLADSAESASRRVALATALELLQIALNIHRLLLTPGQPDTIDRSLLGGTVLVGDYCFSRAAVLAARTHNPQVVTVFANLLQELSEANLRLVINETKSSQEAIAVDRDTLLRSGALAGAMLAGLGQEEQAHVVRYASRLGRNLPATDSLPPHQKERWQVVASLYNSSGEWRKTLSASGVKNS